MSTKQMLFSGFGGQGILFSGKFIAYKGLMEDKSCRSQPHSSLLPGLPL